MSLGKYLTRVVRISVLYKRNFLGLECDYLFRISKLCLDETILRYHKQLGNDQELSIEDDIINKVPPI